MIERSQIHHQFKMELNSVVLPLQPSSSYDNQRSSMFLSRKCWSLAWAPCLVLLLSKPFLLYGTASPGWSWNTATTSYINILNHPSILTTHTQRTKHPWAAFTLSPIKTELVILALVRTAPQQRGVVRGLLRSCSRGRTADLHRIVPVLLQPAV